MLCWKLHPTRVVSLLSKRQAVGGSCENKLLSTSQCDSETQLWTLWVGKLWLREKYVVCVLQVAKLALNS